MNEQEVRQAIVERIKETYPAVNHDFSAFLNGKKVSIDSWVGDCFAALYRKLNLEYDDWRERLFHD